MQSHLTRGVFRAILNNEPFRFSHCRGRLLHAIPSRRVPKGYLYDHGHVQRRGFFAFPTPPPPDQNQVIATEIGLKPMSDLVRSLQSRSRPPPHDTLSKAFRDFFKSRVEAPGVITSFHGRLLVVTWRYLKQRQEELDSKDREALFSRENLETVLYVLAGATCLPESQSAVRKMARFAFLELSADQEYGADDISRQALLAYIRILSFNGDPEEAWRVTLTYSAKLRKSKPSPWLLVTKGFAMNNDGYQLRRIVAGLEKHGFTLDQASHEELTMTLLQQNQVEAAKRMYECPIFDGGKPTMATKIAIIKASIMESDLAWAEKVLRSLPLNADTRDIHLLWEAARGSGASALAERLETWSAKDPQILQSLTISCVNDLIGLANAVGNPQLAADFAGLASQWGVEPDLQTLMLQLESRIQASDLKGTLEYLRRLEDSGSIADISLPLMNKLITMLCLSEQADALFDQISTLLDPLVDNNVRLEADTVAALTLMLLRRHDWDAVSQLLRPRLGSYADDERTRIRRSVLKFILDRSEDDDNVWEAYNLLKVAFPETGVSVRTDIMTAFFQRNRSDLACLVFGHMRQAESFSQRPKPDTYRKCFKGIAMTADRENLELVHNMLKLDLEVELNTRVRNALMFAYAACELPEKAMEVFKDILRSEEGPSHNTITIFFRACESHPTGASEAIKMMQKAKVLEIKMDRRMYTAYIKALAAQGEFDRAAEAVEKMQSESGYEPLSSTIAHFYNVSPHQYSKDQVEKWAKEKYPDLWAELESVNRTEHEEGLRFDGFHDDTHMIT
ncbi:hypothetical protein VTN77DRAFT_995 [Rasamsonia byssochlamydoides]|uniref:uncharacterized protein n=1 Tax=Rasamsonia byssochlamydoides TaxID=89139 RepID=UPI003742DA1C